MNELSSKLSNVLVRLHFWVKLPLTWPIWSNLLTRLSWWFPGQADLCLCGLREAPDPMCWWREALHLSRTHESCTAFWKLWNKFGCKFHNFSLTASSFFIKDGSFLFPDKPLALLRDQKCSHQGKVMVLRWSSGLHAHSAQLDFTCSK